MRLAADLRQTLYTAGLMGNLTERNVHDEPVETLLNRINMFFENRKIKHSFKRETEEQSFSIPDEWCWSYIGDVCYQFSYGTAKKSSSFGLIPVLRMGNLVDGEIDYSDLVYTSDKEDIEKYLLHEGDLLFNRTNSREKVGKVSIYRGQMPAIYAGYLVRFTPIFVNSDYLNFVLQTEYYKNYCQGVKLDAIGQSNINAKKLMAFRFPLPPIEEQQRIVDRINELIPIIDEYEAMEDQLVALKERFPIDLRDAILQAAVLGKLTDQNTQEESELLVKAIRETKKKQLAERTITRDNSCKTKPIEKYEDELPELPANWTWIRLGDICSKIGAGSTPAGGSKVYVKSGIKFLREQNVHNSGLIMDGLVYISEEINDSMRGSQVQAKDILVNITGASIGRNVLVPDDFDLANVNQHVLIVRLIDERLRHYIHLCLQSPFVFNQMMDKQMGDKPGLSATKVANFVIPIPPLEEQQRIVDRLNAILPLCNELAVD